MVQMDTQQLWLDGPLVAMAALRMAMVAKTATHIRWLGGAALNNSEPVREFSVGAQHLLELKRGTHLRQRQPFGVPGATLVKIHSEGSFLATTVNQDGTNWAG
jgi:hypothetical protein